MMAKNNRFRSNQKRQSNKKIAHMNSSLEMDRVRIVKIVLTVLVFLGIFFLLTVYITNKNSDTKSTENKEEESSPIQYEEILVGSSFDMGDEYFVLYYDKSNEELDKSLSAKITSYKEKEDVLRFYTSDLSNAFNKEFVSDEVNHDPKDASELRFQDSTLIVFKDGTILDYIEGEDSITDYLNK